MKHFFLVRHAEYNENTGRINDTGRKQMRELSRDIKEILNKGSAYLFSSTAPRAVDSSQILAAQLGITLEQISYIWSGVNRPAGSFHYAAPLGKIMEIISERRNKALGLIMVTHFEIIERLPDYFFNKEFGINEHIWSVPKGVAIHFDMDLKNYQYLPKLR